MISQIFNALQLRPNLSLQVVSQESIINKLLVAPALISKHVDVKEEEKKSVSRDPADRRPSGISQLDTRESLPDESCDDSISLDPKSDEDLTPKNQCTKLQ